MLNLQQITTNFLKSLGNIGILTREQEYWLFSRLNYYIIVCYAMLSSRGLISFDDPEVSELYARSPSLGERQHGLIYSKISEESDNLSWISSSSKPEDRALHNVIQNIRMIYQILIRYNIRLVISVIKRSYLQQGLTILDLINEGILSLMKTINKFNYTSGNKFSTYSIHWIQQSIYRSINLGSRVVKLPMHVISATKRMNEILGRLSEGEEISKVDEKHLRRTTMLPRRKISLDSFSEDDDKEAPSMQENTAEITDEMIDDEIHKRSVLERDRLDLQLFPWWVRRFITLVRGNCWFTIERRRMARRIAAKTQFGLYLRIYLSKIRDPKRK